ncbi:MAG: hypothetical protein ABH812_02995 [bacterium]
MKRGRGVVTLTAAILLFVAFYSPVHAQYGVYGGGISKSIVIDKSIYNPNQNKGGSNEYVDNFYSTDYRFSPNKEIIFRLKVKNTSDTTLYGITVKDFVPSYLQPTEYLGNYNSDNRTISFNAGDFGVNEEKTYTLKFKTLTQDKLPSNSGIICLTNKADASNDSVYDDDTAQFCIEKQVIGVTEVPSAGPELGLGFLALQGLGFSTGIWLKKRK